MHLATCWPAEDLGRLFCAFFQAVDDDAKDRQKAVLDTVNRFGAGEAVTGWPTAAELLGDLAPFIQDKWQLAIDAMAVFGGNGAANFGWFPTVEEHQIILKPADEIVVVIAIAPTSALTMQATINITEI